MKQNREYKTALYMRLSKSDDTNNQESESISNQRMLLHQYAAKYGFNVVGEYIDDGVSGTTFDREGFNRLKSDIQLHKVDNVICKSFSRLGRDYVENGKLHKYFIQNDIRFISVTDNYDNMVGNPIHMIMSDVMNDLYARDTSKNIKSAFVAKMKEGAFVGAFASYGYIKDTRNKNKLVIDAIAAVTVKRIFRLACDGLEPKEIADTLNKEGIVSPYKYRCQQYQHIDSSRYTDQWKTGTIQKLIKNKIYLGHMVQGKTTTKTIKHSKATPKDTWIIVENTHEPIISTEVFYEANRLMSARRGKRVTGFVNIFHGVAYCSACGRVMSSTGTRRKDEQYDLVCGGYKAAGVKVCTSHRIGYNTLCSIILAAIRQQLNLTDADKQEIIEVLESTTRVKERKPIEVLKDIERKTNKIKQGMKQLYSDYAGGLITEDIRTELLSDYNKELASLKATQEAYKIEQEKEQKRQEVSKKYQELLKQYTDIKELTREIVATFIERIEVEQGSYSNITKQKQQDIRIVFRFSNSPTTYNYKI